MSRRTKMRFPYIAMAHALSKIIALLDDFAHPPWTLRSLQGHLDASFVNLTPGTRTGIVHDVSYAALCAGMSDLEQKLIEIIEEQRRPEEEQASRELLRTIQRAFREALLALPAEEYDWFDIQVRAARQIPGFSEGHPCRGRVFTSS